MENDDKVHFSLLGNGLDFLDSAVTHLVGQPSDRDLKYSLLHLGAGIELILKQRLELEDWELVVAKQGESITIEAYEAGDFKSVGYDDCIKRLEDEVGIDFQDDQKTNWNILRKMRNKMQHFMILEHPEAIQAVAEKGLSSILDFIGSEFSEETFSEQEETLLRNLRAKLKELEEFIDDRMNQVKSQLNDREKSGHLVVQCPFCMQDALVIGDTKGPEEGTCCYFCSYWSSNTYVTAKEYITNILKMTPYLVEKDGGLWPQFECPACHSDSLVDGHYEYICFSCGALWKHGELRFCNDCQRPVEDSDEVSESGGRCGACFREMIRSDNT